MICQSDCWLAILTSNFQLTKLNLGLCLLNSVGRRTRRTSQWDWEQSWWTNFTRLFGGEDHGWITAGDSLEVRHVIVELLALVSEARWCLCEAQIRVSDEISVTRWQSAIFHCETFKSATRSPSLQADRTETHSKNICSFDTFDGQFGVQCSSKCSKGWNLIKKERT